MSERSQYPGDDAEGSGDGSGGSGGGPERPGDGPEGSGGGPEGSGDGSGERAVPGTGTGGGNRPVHGAEPVHGAGPGQGATADGGSGGAAGDAAGRRPERNHGRNGEAGSRNGEAAGVPAASRIRALVRRPRGQGPIRESPFLPAVVVMLIISAAAGLFAGSYTYAMADPTPRRVPLAVVGEPGPAEKGRAFVVALEKQLGSSLERHHYSSYGEARQAVEGQEVFGILRLSGARDVRLDVSSAAGASVAQLLQQAAPKVGRTVGVQVTVKDIKPLDRGDPRGLALFYISLAAVIIGFVGAIQLSVHARALNPPERIAFTAAYALLGGFAITAVVDWMLGAIDLPFAHSWGILALTMFASGMVFTMFNTLFGRWAMIPTWGLMVLLGNPSSGGAVSWPLLPSAFGTVGRWLPPGASVNAQHTAVYFPAHLHPQPYLCLAGWAVVSCTVFWIWRHRHPGGRET